MLSFMKVPPTTYVLQYKHGTIKREGAGLSFFYYVPASTIVTIPMASADVPFVFQEATADFQSVRIQGELTYRIADPKRLASLLDFSVDKRRAYYSEDPRRLPERLIHTLQTLTRAITQRLALRDALTSSDSIVSAHACSVPWLAMQRLRRRVHSGADPGKQSGKIRRHRAHIGSSARPEVGLPLMGSSHLYREVSLGRPRSSSFTDDFVQRQRPYRPRLWRIRGYRSFRRSERETATYRLLMWLRTAGQRCW